MFSVDPYISSITYNLEKQSTILIGKLNEIFAYNFSPNIDLLDISTFLDATRFEASFMLFSMDKDANEVFSKEDELTVFAGSIELLSNVLYYKVNDTESDNFFDFYEQNAERLEGEEKRVFTEWFSKCWEQAGGQGFQLPSYFGFHDESSSYDLLNNQFVEDEEKWTD